VKRVGVDIGGTNTDLVWVQDQAIRLAKVPSNNLDPAEAVHRGLEQLGLDLAQTELFAHGTTVATNAVLQRRGARAALITTKGFRDVLQIRRTTRGELYDFQWDPPQELVPRRWRLEVTERTAATGVVLTEPDIAAAVALASQKVAEGAESIAVAFINSYRNPANEHAVKAALVAQFPGLPVYASADLLPAWREFERTSTACVGAYVGPVLTDYLRSLEDFLSQRGYSYDLLVMQSNGGLGTAQAAIANPVATLMSGPAAGVVAEVALGEQLALGDLVGVDVGGTSTDISVVLDGKAQMRSEYDIEFGTVVALPMIEIESIAAGGGTICWVDEGGWLHAGPASAGAMPGPACYDRGGKDPTLTDAYVITGRLDQTELLGGALPIKQELAVQAVTRLGQQCDLELHPMARGIIALVVSNIAAAVRRVTIQRGVDPRDLTLVAYGGGGPTLACDVAEDLGVRRIAIPRWPGLTCAAGLLMTDVRHDFVTTLLEISDQVDWAAVGAVFDELIEDGRRKLAAEGIDQTRQRFELAADLRYLGQTHELTVALGSGYSASVHGALEAKLRQDHLKQFGHAPEEAAAVEIVALRVAAYGLVATPSFGQAETKPQAKPTNWRQCDDRGQAVTTPVFSRDDLGAGCAIAGPALIQQVDTTTYVASGWSARVAEDGSLVLHQLLDTGSKVA